MEGRCCGLLLGHGGAVLWERGELNGRATDLWSKGLGLESRQKRRKLFLLQGQRSVLTLTSTVSVLPQCYRSST